MTAPGITKREVIGTYAIVYVIVECPLAFDFGYSVLARARDQATCLSVYKGHYDTHSTYLGL